MGIGIALAVGALVVGVLAAVMFRPQMEGQDMKAATLDSFQMTTTDEGSVVPWICGYVRTKANLIWFGNLDSVAQTQSAGGKGGGQDITTGYKYYLDLWKAICLGGSDYGTVTWEAVYVSDRLVVVADQSPAWDYTFNDGTQLTYPTEPGDKANPIPGVAHIFLRQYYLGVNVTHVPTFHFIMRGQSPAPLTYANMSSGVNPAARIYDILKLAGSQSGDFNLTSFQEAANYWNTVGYGLNFSYSQQKEAREWINQVFTYVDGCLRKDSNDQWFLQAYTKDDISVATFNKEDMINFDLTRRSWSETYNDFIANYTDKNFAYTKRTIRVQNGANQRLLGYKRPRTVDLTAFIEVGTASRRLSEIMKRESYPEAQVSFSASLRYEEHCHVGKVITLNHDEYGIANASYRIIQRDVNETDSNLLDFRAMQQVETLFDDTYVDGGSPEWEVPEWQGDIALPLAQDWFELPLNSISGHDPAILVLVARPGIEEGFLFYTSISGVDYAIDTNQGSAVFAQHGTLDEAYPDSDETDTIDDDLGILYTPTNEDPVFESISRQNLYYTRRVAIIGGTEMVAFQTVTYEGGSSIRLTGVVRGILNTPTSLHASGTKIWLVDLSQVSLGQRPWMIQPSLTDFYVKPIMHSGSQIADVSDVTAMHVTVANKARIAPPPSRIVVVRSGDSVSITVYQSQTHLTAPSKAGAGEQALDGQSDYGWSSGMDLGNYITEKGDDDFISYSVQYAAYVRSYDNLITFSYSNAASFNLRVRRWDDGEIAQFTVPSGSGTTIWPEI